MPTSKSNLYQYWTELRHDLSEKLDVSEKGNQPVVCRAQLSIQTSHDALGQLTSIKTLYHFSRAELSSTPVFIAWKPYARQATAPLWKRISRPNGSTATTSMPNIDFYMGICGLAKLGSTTSFLSCRTAA
jgi:hypothetical protein